MLKGIHFVVDESGRSDEPRETFEEVKRRLIEQGKLSVPVPLRMR
jgi:hypothetical protein